VLCGKGNNGGDGFVCARYLFEQSFDVHAVICSDGLGFTPDAHKNLEHLLLLGARISDFSGTLPQCDVIVDALLGTGFRGEPKPPLDKALAAIEDARLRGARIFSADIPSGVDGNTGAAAKNAVRAEATVTFGFAKLGLFLHPGRAHAGALTIADIGFDARAIAELPIKFEFPHVRKCMHFCRLALPMVTKANLEKCSWWLAAWA
jgi:NAD(P)H-hydrate epimerase